MKSMANACLYQYLQKSNSDIEIDILSNNIEEVDVIGIELEEKEILRMKFHLLPVKLKRKLSWLAFCLFQSVDNLQHFVNSLIWQSQNDCPNFQIFIGS